MTVCLRVQVRTDRDDVVRTADQKVTHHGTRERLWDVNQKLNWKTTSPRTEMARSPYVVPFHGIIRMTGHTRTRRAQPKPTWGRGKPKAEPKTMARRANQPRPNLTFLGRRSNGLATRGPQTAATGLLTTELGMNRNAIILRE